LVFFAWTLLSFLLFYPYPVSTLSFLPPIFSILSPLLSILRKCKTYRIVKMLNDISWQNVLDFMHTLYKIDWNTMRKSNARTLKCSNSLVWLVVFNATFKHISVILWRSVLLMEETRVPRESHRYFASHWQTLSHNVVSSMNGVRTQNIGGNRYWLQLLIKLPYDHDGPRRICTLRQPVV
jgi:hypothetical protein